MKREKQPKTTILVFGGSFDPPHWGHIKIALNVQRYFQFMRFVFLPCKTPVLKKPALATAEQRLTMLKLALADYPQFEIDKREVYRTTPSYMVHTLEHFRAELGEQAAITLLLGMDAFLQLPQWHQWERLLPLAHLLILNRTAVADEGLPPKLTPLLLTNKTDNKNDLLQQPSSKLFFYDAGNYPISSTDLRRKIHSGESIQSFVPPAVMQYIKDQALYQ